MKVNIFQIECKAKAGGVLEIYLYDAVGEKSTTSKALMEQLSAAGNVSSIDIHINSAGGSVVEGMGIYGLLKQHPAKKTVYIDGIAGSMASLIAMAGDSVKMFRNSLMFVHNATIPAEGTASELRKSADFLDSLMEGFRGVYLSKSAGKMSEERLAAMLDTETWLTAAQCLECGLADEIIDGVANIGNATAMLENEKKRMSERLQSLAASVECIKTILDEPEQEPPPPPPEPPEQKTKHDYAAVLAAYFMPKMKGEN